MKIGILGIAMKYPDNGGGNLGCLALGYSFFEVINQIAVKNGLTIDVVCIGNKPAKKRTKIKTTVMGVFGYEGRLLNYYKSLYSNLVFSRGYYYMNGSKVCLSNNVLKCKCVIDFTAGDSFTDLYGRDRFFQRTKIKEIIEDYNIPLILGSQTIGPFVDEDVKNFAKRVIEKAHRVYVRDEKSLHYVEQISYAKPILTTDIAFFLPYDKSIWKYGNNKIGFNPSGLLWCGGYTKNNQFGLTVDYQRYCRNVILCLIESGYEVHLIMHAYFMTKQKENNCPDNDWLAVQELHNEFPSTIVAPLFKTPMEAKSYISVMNLFIGARMHATIGALSAAIPVLPFSYSRKFEGLFSSLQYPYVIEGTKWDTNRAVETTIRWVGEIEKLKERISECTTIIAEKNELLLKNYEKYLVSLLNEE